MDEPAIAGELTAETLDYDGGWEVTITYPRTPALSALAGIAARNHAPFYVSLESALNKSS
jgi:hypothetical protein